MPERPRIPLSNPEISGNEWLYVKKCLDSAWVSSAGSYVNEFEKNLSGMVNKQHVVATSSGTAALHLALLSLNIGAGDEVLVSDLTFAAPLNTIRYCGAEPILVDSDRESWQLDPELIREFLRKQCARSTRGLINQTSGRRVAAILPVHILGHPGPESQISELASEFDLFVIDDISETLGAKVRGRPVGGGATVACYSFNGNKIVTAGGGGALATNESAVAERAFYLSTQAKDDPIFYGHNEIGYNYRLTNLQAALAVAQLERLEEFVERKRAIAKIYSSRLIGCSALELLDVANDHFATFWLNTILLPSATKRNLLMERMNKSNIESRPLWKPNHMNRPFQKAQYLTCGDSVSEGIVDRSLSLPSSVSLTPNDQERVCLEILDFMESAP